MDWGEFPAKRAEKERILNMACFKENEIACTKPQHMTCVNTNPNTKSAPIELYTRASRAASTRELNDGKNFRDKSKGRPRKSRLAFVDGGWFTILRPGIYNNAMLGFCRIRQALCIALSVFLRVLVRVAIAP